MLPVSDRWASSINKPHRLETKVTLLDTTGGETVLTPIAGQVTLDVTAAIRGRVDLTFAESSDVPVAVTDLLAPYGNEIKVERGLRYLDGTVELVPLGVFGIEDASTSDRGGELETRVSGLDRARRIERALFEQPLEIAAGSTASEIILSVVQGAYPDVSYAEGLESVSAAELPKVIAAEGEDRWAFAQGLAQAIGCVLYFDNQGVLTLRPYAPGESEAAVTLSEGDVLIEVERDWSREATYNRFIVTGENSDEDAVYRGVATDSNPASPTYYGGPFGAAPRFWSSPYIVSDEQAQDAAEAMLAQELGTLSSIAFQAVPNPALEPLDQIIIKRKRMGLTANACVLDSVSIGLGPEDSMTGQTREVLVAS